MNLLPGSLQDQHSPSPKSGFRNKALAALLSSVGGAIGAQRWYLGLRWPWAPIATTALCAPLMMNVSNWYQTPPFFIVMIPVVWGFIDALFIALMPDKKFDARFNANHIRTNQSGWNAVLVAIATLMVGTTLLMTTIALLFQTLFEHMQGVN